MAEVEKRNLNFRAFLMSIFLLFQYLLGVINTYFVEFPDTYDKEALWRFAWNQISVALHIILGFGLLIGSILLIVSAIRNKAKSWFLPSWMAFLSIFGAFISGALFVDFQNDIYSFAMATFFAVAIFSYIWGIYRTK